MLLHVVRPSCDALDCDLLDLTRVLVQFDRLGHAYRMQSPVLYQTVWGWSRSCAKVSLTPLKRCFEGRILKKKGGWKRVKLPVCWLCSVLMAVGWHVTYFLWTGSYSSTTDSRVPETVRRCIAGTGDTQRGQSRIEFSLLRFIVGSVTCLSAQQQWKTAHAQISITTHRSSWIGHYTGVFKMMFVLTLARSVKRTLLPSSLILTENGPWQPEFCNDFYGNVKGEIWTWSMRSKPENAGVSEKSLPSA